MAKASEEVFIRGQEQFPSNSRGRLSTASVAKCVKKEAPCPERAKGELWPVKAKRWRNCDESENIRK